MSASIANRKSQIENPGMAPNPSDETIRIGPLVIHFLVTGADSNGSVAAFELTVPGSQRLAAPSHSHNAYEETIYQLQGELTWTVNGQTHTLSPGQSLCIPRGAIIVSTTTSARIPSRSA
jgi:quercetin dioxygenase-like cupin family protein